MVKNEPTLTTKGRILETAINLFAEKGFNDVSIRDLTKAVGIKESSLYNHFSSKQQILEDIFDYLVKHFESITPSEMDMVKNYEKMTPEDFVESTLGVFKLYMGDPKLMKIWRILSIERFRNKQANEFLVARLIEDALNYQAKVLEYMMAKGTVKKADPMAMAREMYAFMIYIYFRYFESGEIANPTEDPEIQEQVRQHFAFFIEASRP